MDMISWKLLGHQLIFAQAKLLASCPHIISTLPDKDVCGKWNVENSRMLGDNSWRWYWFSRLTFGTCADWGWTGKRVNQLAVACLLVVSVSKQFTWKYFWRNFLCSALSSSFAFEDSLTFIGDNWDKCWARWG